MILNGEMPGWHRNGSILARRRLHRQPRPWNLVDNIRGNRCLLCDGRGQDRCLCPGCLADLPWQGPACRCCALPLPEADEETVCGDCRRDPPAWQETLALFRYAFPVDRLIAAFKYHDRLALADTLGRLLADRVDPQRYPDLIVPVPLHPQRLRARGSHQTALLARTAGHALGLPVDDRRLCRVRDTTMQKLLDREARRANLQEAFAWQGRSLAGAHVAVVDDVMTTGATLAAITPHLLAAGAGGVSAWVVARTLPD